MEIYLQIFYSTHRHCIIELSVHGDGGMLIFSATVIIVVPVMNV